ncbi:uncharacterized protein LOC127791967 [Diospyros lotus]|uniref:uncharacterized protein LOC127791967 n=1 Tax=Diospyros lotus TaxID=55363 RepID=UPI0022542795|nr:uncharacterized protein LOC127791967 [Diospyros lotus]
MEVVDVMIRRKINIMCLQEMRWVGKKAKTLSEAGYKIWYTGTDRAKNGVGIIMDKSLIDEVVDVKRIGDRIIMVKISLGRMTMNIFSTYAPQARLGDEIKAKFWEDLEGLIQMIPRGEKVIIRGDLNGHVGRDGNGYREVHGGYGFGEINNEGKSILDFAMAYGLIITNTRFKNRDEHLITYKNVTSSTQIDYFLMRQEDRVCCRDCKVIPGECLTTQHRLLVLDVQVRNWKRKNHIKQNPRIRWWNLKGEKQLIFKEKLRGRREWNREGQTNQMWREMANALRNTAKVVLRETNGRAPNLKESWWWNEEVQLKIKNKKNCYKAVYQCNNEENQKNYKE